jgi:hypothetical protein
MKFGLGPWWKKLFIYAQVVSQKNNIHIFCQGKTSDACTFTPINMLETFYI